MKFRTSNLMIGTLPLAVIAASFGGWLGYQKFAGIKQRVPFRVVFEGSASGLRKGGSVNFAGIRVGEVVSLKLDNPRRVERTRWWDWISGAVPGARRSRSPAPPSRGRRLRWTRTAFRC